MSIKSDKWNRKMAREHGMIEPFEDRQVREGAISYGVSSYGYDIRIADEFLIFTNVNSTIVDPKNFDERSLVHVKDDTCIIPPNSFALARRWSISASPEACSPSASARAPTRAAASSSTSRPLNPSGRASSPSRCRTPRPCPPKIYANEGIAQVLFFESDEECETILRRQKGKYQKQQGLTLAKL